MVVFMKRSSAALIVLILALGYLTYRIRMDKAANVMVTERNLSLIVIDAGHGAPDGGATGLVSGVLEKDLNLDIAKKLEERLTIAGFTVIMTRTGDDAIYSKTAKTIREKKRTDLHNRRDIINSSNAAALISIHMNTFPGREQHGADILFAKNIAGSDKLAESIKAQIRLEVEPSNKRENKPAPNSIFLLKEALIPSVIVECGFLTNADDEANLRDAVFQSRMAQAICNGVIKYIERERLAPSATPSASPLH